MDKYEYNLKLEEIDKLVDQKDYEEAAKMADTIDWKRVRNVRTLCLISEIYEAADRLEDSKVLLQRAYRRSPNGRTILYRLTEVTTGLGQYDEAMEYYTEYVQAAPHDTNHYILKYRIYRGRGASAEELIPILEEFLGQEYTEKWAYELARLYLKAGQTQKCLATCDDLVLWFHTGKYVRKALELKKRYAALTPKQQAFYEQILEEEKEKERAQSLPEQPEAVPGQVDGEILAESIMAETEKTIATDVSAHKSQEDSPENSPAGAVPAVEPERRQDKADSPAVQRPDSAMTEEQKPETVTEAVKTEEQKPETVTEAAKAEEQKPETVTEATKAEEQKPETVTEAAKAEEQKPETGTETAKAEEQKPETVTETAKAEEQKPETVTEAAKTEEQKPETGTETAKEDKNIPEPGPLTASEILEAEIRKTREAVAQNLQASPAVQTDSAAHLQQAAGTSKEDASPKEESNDSRDLPLELAKSMREIISGVVRKEEPEEEPDFRVRDAVLQDIPRPQAQPEQLPEAPRLSIDDVLLSMGAQGRELTKNYRTERDTESAAESRQDPAADPYALDRRSWVRDAAPRGMSLTEAAEKDLTDAEKEALQYSSDPVRALRSRKNLPSYREDGETREPQGEVIPPEDLSIRQEVFLNEEPGGMNGQAQAQENGQTAADASAGEQDVRKAENPLGKTRRFDSLRERVQSGILSKKTREIPVEEVARRRKSHLRKEILAQEDGTGEYGQQEKHSGQGYSTQNASAASGFRDGRDAAQAGYTPGDVRDNAQADYAPGDGRDAAQASSAFDDGRDAAQASSAFDDGRDAVQAESGFRSGPDAASAGPDGTGTGAEDAAALDAAQNPENMALEEEPGVRLPDYQRYLFAGFTEVEGLEKQIADAIALAASRGEDRTSRTGNILILGPHASGKTTLAMNIAKAVAQERGVQTMKIARIYAADFNRKDIASTIAKVAGGTLIIEEAGDLDTNAIEQLTTAMEFRTNGLLVILEDEQQYLHELLMSHPRFTMKFTAQIYIPVYTARELLNFSELIANEKGCTISEDGAQVILERISRSAAGGQTVTVSDMAAMVKEASEKSAKFFRKLAMGRKRYDENDYIILFAKDFR